MSYSAKVLWGEGLFLRPQHFQRQDAYHEARLFESVRAIQPYNWGVAGRNVLTGPRAANFDLTAEKKFLFTEVRQLWFRAEFFNAFNHPQFGIPASTIGGTGVGTISGTARPSRQIQFALKLLF